MVTPADRRAATRVRRSPVLRRLAGTGIRGAMQAALIADIHPVPGAGVPLTDNPLTWNSARFTWETAAHYIADDDADDRGARARLLADV
jgi:hypothetical protein